MATSAPRRCTTAGCPHPALPGGACDDHKRQRDAARNQRRNADRTQSLAVYKSKRWKKLRRSVINEEPYCQHTDCGRPSTDVDHIRRIEDGGDPWNRENLQALCHSHHSQKTAAETGFGGSTPHT